MMGDPIHWLLQGDPAIRWQVMRDLQGAPENEWGPERAMTSEAGLGKRFLDLQDPDGGWDGGVYSPKWTSTTFTLLTLIDFGLSPENPQGQKGAEKILASLSQADLSTRRLRLDLCVYGFYLHILSYFNLRDPRVPQILELILARQMADGGWNCRRDRVPTTRHSSFHTTFNVLEGLRAAERAGFLETATFREAEARAVEFMLLHRMYLSDRTGEVIDTHFTELSYPPRWHYDVLRGLDYIGHTPYRYDPRLNDATVVLKSKAIDGIWPAQNKHAGKVFFPIESPPRQSRWNTLRALRFLTAIGEEA